MSFSRAISKAGSLQSGCLLVGLVTLIVTSFVKVEPGTAAAITLGGLYVAVFSVAGYLIGARRKWMIAYAVVVVPAIIAGGAASMLSSPPAELAVARDALGLALQILLVLLVFRFSLFENNASRADRITAGICGYLILALMWANLYSLHEYFRPGEIIDSTGSPITGESGGFLYYSIVTLTSTGYGDILAKTSSARLLACFESITGTLYLAVFISALVGTAPKAPPGTH